MLCSASLFECYLQHCKWKASTGSVKICIQEHHYLYFDIACCMWLWKLIINSEATCLYTQVCDRAEKFHCGNSKLLTSPKKCTYMAITTWAKTLYNATHFALKTFKMIKTRNLKQTSVAQWTSCSYELYCVQWGRSSRIYKNNATFLHTQDHVKILKGNFCWDYSWDNVYKRVNF